MIKDDAHKTLLQLQVQKNHLHSKGHILWGMRTRASINKAIRCRHKNILPLWIDLWIKRKEDSAENTVGMKEAECEKNIKPDNDKL